MRAEALVDVIRLERTGAFICHLLTLPIRFFVPTTPRAGASR